MTTSGLLKPKRGTGAFLPFRLTWIPVFLTYFVLFKTVKVHFYFENKYRKKSFPFIENDLVGDEMYNIKNGQIQALVQSKLRLERKCEKQTSIVKKILD